MALGGVGERADESDGRSAFEGRIREGVEGVRDTGLLDGSVIPDSAAEPPGEGERGGGAEELPAGDAGGVQRQGKASSMERNRCTSSSRSSR